MSELRENDVREEIREGGQLYQMVKFCRKSE